MSLALIKPSIAPVASTTRSSRTPRAIISLLARASVAPAWMVAAATCRRSVITSIAGVSDFTGLGPTTGGWHTTPGRIRVIGSGL